jgi:hypothetical protein
VFGIKLRRSRGEAVISWGRKDVEPVRYSYCGLIYGALVADTNLV